MKDEPNGGLAKRLRVEGTKIVKLGTKRNVFRIQMNREMCHKSIAPLPSFWEPLKKTRKGGQGVMLKPAKWWQEMKLDG